jgi:hypothetical protein
MKDGGGNDGLWTLRKTKGRFSSVPTALGNREARFPHSHRRDELWKSGKPKNGPSHFPTAHGFIFLTELRKEAWRVELRSPSRLIVRLENATCGLSRKRIPFAEFY